MSRTDQQVLSKHMAHSLHTADTQYDESRQFGARLSVLERAEELARDAAREELQVGDVDPAVQEPGPKSTHIPPATASGSKGFDDMNESEQTELLIERSKFDMGRRYEKDSESD